MMFQGGGMPPQLQAMLAQRAGGMGAMAPPVNAQGMSAMMGGPKVPMPGYQQGAGMAAPQPMAMPQGPQQGGMFGNLSPTDILTMANMFKPKPDAAEPMMGGKLSTLGGGGGGMQGLLQMLGGAVY